jgi:ubiquinone/menaquinone biosynthesis C-methylase UbiE
MKPFFGNGEGRMSDNRFRLMSFFFAVRDIVAPHDYKLDSFGIKKGDTVVDFGCGTGSCLRKAAELSGPAGTVYAVDIHEMALECAKRVSVTYGLATVKPLKTDGVSCAVPASSADVVYALDMFHMVPDSGVFLKELRRIVKKSGTLFIEDGHQPRSVSKTKILESGLWKIAEETRVWMKCVPA